MRTSMKAKASGFHFVNGVSRQGAPNSLIVGKGPEIPAKPSSKGNLYLLVEVIGNPPGSDHLTSQLVDLIRKTYLGARGTVTNGLRMALDAANQFLLDLNLKSAYEEQRDASVCAVVLRGHSAYVACSGPCAVYYVRGTSWQHYPIVDPDDPASSAVTVPVGLRNEPIIALYHIDIAPGDLLFLVDSRGTQALSQIQVSGPAEAAATAALRNAAQKADFSTLLVEVGGEGKAAGAFVGLEDHDAARPSKPSAGPDGYRPGFRLPRRSRPEKRRARGKAAEMEDTSVIEDEVGYDGAPYELEAMAEEYDDASLAVSMEKPKPAPRRVNRVPLVLALLVPLLVVGAIYGYNTYQQRQLEEKFLSELAEAQSLYLTAKTTSDKQVARTALQTAQGHLNMALEIRPDDQVSLRLQQDMQTLNDELNMVVPLYHTVKLYAFPPENGDPQRMAVNGGDIYVLDKQNGIVTMHVMNELGDGLERGQESIEVVRKGQQIGSFVVGNLIGLTWMAATDSSQQDSLVILEASGHIIFYNENGLWEQTLPNAASLQSPLYISSFAGGRLYVLDTTVNQIFRYTSGSNGYSAEPENYFADDVQVDLRNARDMAIDGDVWLMFPEGIARYRAGRLIAFDIYGLLEPFSSPVGLFAAADSGTISTQSLYVADPGNGRVVELTKEGQFVRQFRPPEGMEFSELHDLHVAEAEGKMYFLSGDSLFLASMPGGN